jgi:hypothetical protein
LRRKLVEPKLIGHEVRNLAARPHPAVWRRLLQPILELRQNLRLEHRWRAAVVTAKVAERLRSQGVVAGLQFLDPARHKAGQFRHLGNRMTLRQKPNGLVMPRRARIRARTIPLFQLLDAQMIRHMRHGPPPAIHGAPT